MRRADRLFRIVLLLGRGKVVTARELAESLEVSERTVYRDIADLAVSGVPVEGAAGVGYLLRSGYHLPPLMFDQEELQALVMGIRMVQGWADNALGQAAETALAKIETVLPGALRQATANSGIVVPDFHVPQAMVEPLEDLRRAIVAGRKVRLGYRRADGTTSARTVLPLSLFYWGQVWTLGAWCELRGDYRSFRPDRMDEVELLEASFQADQARLLKGYLNGAQCDGLAE
ncbi:MAG: YafY family transcriptional regulator [Rhodocyclaceae bacterium]|nr:MAG: YafY family transcriptional regulator [Rhodocyclaceae bacterium]